MAEGSFNLSCASCGKSTLVRIVLEDSELRVYTSRVERVGQRKQDS